MERGQKYFWLIMAAMVALFSAVLPAQASEPCAAPNALSGSVLQQVQALDSAQCATQEFGNSGARQFLRIDVSGASDAAPPRYFISRTAMFDQLTLVARDKVGNWATASYRLDELKPTFLDRQFYAELP